MTIELPPLPNDNIAQRMTEIEVRSLLKRYGERCATAAVEADRQARGEPVAWLRNERDGYEGEAVFDPLVILGSAPPTKTVNGATYSPVFSAPQPQQIPENIKQVIKKAYGHLWMVNNEPGTPNQYPPEHAIYKARQLLLGILTKEERGDGINSAMLEAAPEVKP